MAEAVLTTHLEATPEQVWAALTEADALADWYWPASTDETAEMYRSGWQSCLDRLPAYLRKSPTA